MSSSSSAVPEASVHRLSLYHCFVGELIREGGAARVTSRQLAMALGVREETVRRDISFISCVGRPGAGYELRFLHSALTDFLGLSDNYPIIKIGTAQMISALRAIFPPNAYGLRSVAHFSELPEDVGKVVNDVPVKHISDIPNLDPSLGVDVALVACSPAWVQVTLDLAAQAGIFGVLLLTPMMRLDLPDGMTISQIRMPCDIKSLACRCHR